MLTQDEEKRLEQLEQFKQARSDAEGQAKPGYKTNIALVNAQISQLKKKRGDSSTIIVT